MPYLGLSCSPDFQIFIRNSVKIIKIHVQNFDGIVITGSKHDAFGDDPWIVKLRYLMKREAARKQQILGLCFGAQLLAVALGGKAGNSPF